MKSTNTAAYVLITVLCLVVLVLTILQTQAQANMARITVLSDEARMCEVKQAAVDARQDAQIETTFLLLKDIKQDTEKINTLLLEYMREK